MPSDKQIAIQYRKEQDEIIKRKLAVTPLRFEANGKEMMYCYPDSKHRSTLDIEIGNVS